MNFFSTRKQKRTSHSGRAVVVDLIGHRQDQLPYSGVKGKLHRHVVS